MIRLFSLIFWLPIILAQAVVVFVCLLVSPNDTYKELKDKNDFI
ncbi:hypothetical protein QE357_002246 [Siphonobacter sp. BAB-5404]|nr:hypothetical protein [Siphonobacter sp. SORGH_AS_0500]